MLVQTSFKWSITLYIVCNKLIFYEIFFANKMIKGNVNWIYEFQNSCNLAGRTSVKASVTIFKLDRQD